MKFIDVTNDYYLRKGMELERYRDKLLDQYNLSKNPKVLDQFKKVSEECNSIWTTIKLIEYNKIGMKSFMEGK